MDSTVCTALLNRALNRDQVIAVHIDNGFMRKRESQSVEEALKKLGIQVKGTTELWQSSFNCGPVCSVVKSPPVELHYLFYMSVFRN